MDDNALQIIASVTIFGATEDRAVGIPPWE